MLMHTLEHAARALGGEVRGGRIYFPGPNHDGRDRSAWLQFHSRAPGGFLAGTFSPANDWAEIRDYVRDRLGLGRERVAAPAPTVAPKPPKTDAERTARALAIWRESRHPRGTAVETYLARRGLTLPDEAAGEAIRFHPACPFRGQRMSCMVALVADVVTNAPKAIHRTALTTDGRKAVVEGLARLSLGPVGGGAVKLTADENVTLCLGIGEGIESTLSLRLAPEFGASPVWALLSAGQVAMLPVLAGIEALWIAVDHDPAGIRAADTVAERWRTAGREVFKVRPIAHQTDLNDLTRVA